MKVAIVLVGVLVVCGFAFASPNAEQKLELNDAPIKPRLFEDSINSTINSIVAKVAPYDPINIEQQQQDFMGYGIEIHNLQAEGFSNVVATDIKLSGLVTWTLQLTIEARKIAGSVEYWKVDGVEFYGNGSARVEINNLKLKVKAKINPLSKDIKEVVLTPSIGHADVSITGIYNDEELSTKISDRLNVFLNDDINNNKDLHKKSATLFAILYNNILIHVRANLTL